MAEITNHSTGKQKGMVKKLVRKTTRVDLTPMVDLGFLLITFFVFTTTMATPKVMNIRVPQEQDTSRDLLPESNVISFLLSSGNHIYYREGSDRPDLYRETNYSPAGIRRLIMEKKKQVISTTGKDKVILIIKPGDSSTFKNLINVIDEAAICRATRCYITAPESQDLKWLAANK